MKPESHVSQLVAAQALQLIVLALALWFYSYHVHGYPVLLYLITDLFLGLSLLPVMAAIRRGPIVAKFCGLLLLLLPAYYISYSIREKGPILMEILGEPR